MWTFISLFPGPIENSPYSGVILNQLGECGEAYVKAYKFPRPLFYINLLQNRHLFFFQKRKNLAFVIQNCGPNWILVENNVLGSSW